MAASKLQDMLKHEIDGLPEPLVAEVLDFVLFMKARHEEEQFLWEQACVARAYREQHPEEVVIVTAEEWESATAHLEE